MTETAITVSKVFKNFRLPHEKHVSIKSAFTSMFRGGKRGATTQHALRDISFSVNKGEFFGIVGRNGSGKSTLLKMLAGIYQPTSGKISVEGKLVPFIELGVGFNPELSGRENVYLNGALLGFSKKQIDVQYDNIVEFAELEDFMDQKLKNYSSGMQVRLAFSLATRAEADILLVDEVLAVGDAAFQRKCFEYFKELKARKKTVVFVTHDMNAVREYCDRAVLIDDSRIKHIGTPEEVSKQYALLFMNEDAETTENGGQRWGNGHLKVGKVKAGIVGDDLVVEATARINEDIDCVTYGLHVVGQDGQEITAMNNRMIQTDDVRGLKRGSTVKFTWNMLNVFNDGRYTVTLTFIDDVATPLDWITKAANFTVKRTSRSTTPVLPPVKVTHKIDS